MESPHRDLFINTEIFPPLSLHLLNWNYFSVLFCLFYVKKLIMRLLIAGNVRPGHPGQYHFLQGTDVHRVFWVSVGDKKFISYFLRIPQRLMVTRVTIICTSSLLYFTVWLGQKYLLLFCIQSDCTASTLHWKIQQKRCKKKKLEESSRQCSCNICKSLFFSPRAGLHLWRNCTWSHSRSHERASDQVKIKNWSYKREGIQACRKNQNRSIFFQLHFHCDVYYPMKTKLSGLQPEAEELTHHKTCLLFTNNPVSSEHRQWSWKFFFIYLFSFFWLILQKQVAKHVEYLSIPGVPGLNNAWKKSNTTRASQQGAHESFCHKYIQYKFHESYIHSH